MKIFELFRVLLEYDMDKNFLVVNNLLVEMYNMEIHDEVEYEDIMEDFRKCFDMLILALEYGFSHILMIIRMFLN